nr:NADP-dependent oxidoreductase [uncultured Blautia sp.]
MKQVIYRKQGGPEVLELRDVPIPEVKKGEVLVRMLATSVNGGDLGLRRGNPKKNHKEMKRPKRIGIDVVGVVEKLGENVTDFKVGDLVWGNSGPDNGTTAEYSAISAKKISLMPEGMEPTTAAAFPTVGITAITALFDVGKLKAGERILVRGIGGVGLTAMQIAKAHGTHVTVLCSRKIVDRVKEFGAEEAYDYRKTPIE